jgi:hypothetical protein
MNTELIALSTRHSSFHKRTACAILCVAALTLWGAPKARAAKAKKVPGLENFHVSVFKAKLRVAFVSTTLHLDGGGTFPVPGLGDAVFEVAPDFESDGTLFAFTVSLASLLNHGQALKWTGLPDGRPLPDVVGGKLPRGDLPIKSFKVSLYLSDDAFGVFVPLKFMSANGSLLTSMVSMEIVDERGNRLGKVYAIPSNVSGSGSGLFVLLPYIGGSHSEGNPSSKTMLH